MPGVTYDASVFIAYKPVVFPAGFLLSAVVVQELAAGATDKSDLQRLDAVRRTYEKEGRLLLPTSQEWWLAGEGFHLLFPRLQNKTSGGAPRIPEAGPQRSVR